MKRPAALETHKLKKTFAAQKPGQVSNAITEGDADHEAGSMMRFEENTQVS